MKPRHRRKRRIQDLHFLNGDGMVACNPRDREAIHRAEVEGIATKNLEAVTCKKCRAAIRRSKKGDFERILAKVQSRRPLPGDEA